MVFLCHRDQGELDQSVAPWILLLALLEDQRDVCFLPVLRHLLWSSYHFKDDWEWPLNDVSQISQHPWVQPFRSHVRKDVRSTAPAAALASPGLPSRLLELLDMAVAFQFAGSTNSKSEHVSQTPTGPTGCSLHTCSPHTPVPQAPHTRRAPWIPEQTLLSPDTPAQTKASYLPAGPAWSLPAASHAHPTHNPRTPGSRKVQTLIPNRQHPAQGLWLVVLIQLLALSPSLASLMYVPTL